MEEKSQWERDWESLGLVTYKGYDVKYSYLIYFYVKGRQNRGKLIKTLSALRTGLSVIKSYCVSLLTPKKSSWKSLNLELNGRILESMNAYAINFLPSDLRHFLHISSLAEKDDSSVVLTTKKKVYDYFAQREKPVIFFARLGRQIKYDSNARRLGFRERAMYSRSAGLIDNLESVESRLGNPKSIIVLQDFHTEDSVFATFYKDKVPTVTLQHGMVNPGGLWQFVLSDYIICWGRKSTENLHKSGIPNEKIIPLGTAKYDQYLSSRIERDKQKRNFVIQIGIQQGSVLGEEYERKTYEFFREFIYSHPEYDYVLKFHPAKRKSEMKKYKRLASVRNVRISSSNNAYELISESDVVLTYRTTLATDAMILDRPVIEYQLLSKDQTDGPFGDYRDSVIRISDHASLEQELWHISIDKHYRDAIISKQREFLREEMLPPPNARRIIDFLNSLSLRKE